MQSKPLSPAERDAWHTWKRAADAVMARIGHDINAETGLSGADYDVLSRLDELGQGELPQRALHRSTGWDKSRLSHHLTRMEARGLVRRKSAKGGPVLVSLTSAGRRALDSARPIHARAVRRNFLAQMSSSERAALVRLFSRLIDT